MVRKYSEDYGYGWLIMSNNINVWTLKEHITLIFLSYFFISFSKAKTRQSWPICQQSGKRPALVDWNYWDQDIFTTTTTTTTTESYDYYDYFDNKLLDILVGVRKGHM